MSSLENDRRRAQRWVRSYPDEVSLVAQQACEQVVKTLMSGLALHSLMESELPLPKMDSNELVQNYV
jgi:hypothetical protein